MNDGDELERQLESDVARMKKRVVPASVESHWKGCRSCLWQFAECKEGSLYRPKLGTLARSPCSSWKSCGLQSLPEG